MSHAVAVSRSCAESYALHDWQPEVVYGAAPVPDAPMPSRPDLDPFTVAMIGVVSKRKGSDLFVAAAERLRDAGSAIRLTLVGRPTDPLDRDWGEAVIERAIAAGVSYEPEVEMPAALCRWNAVALPSRRDPFPLVGLEAMGAGLPVIGSAVDGIAEQLEGGAGVLIPPDDPDELAAAILQIASLPERERRALGARARARVIERFELGRQAAEMAAAYERCASGG